MTSSNVSVRRLTAGDRNLARNLFKLMADVFGEEQSPLSDRYLDNLLARAELWALAAFSGADLVGGLAAHTLPMTSAERSELFIYDLAVRQDFQRQGVGRSLVEALRQQASAAGIQEVFVPADNADQHALDFYRALGGTPAPVTIFTFSE